MFDLPVGLAEERKAATKFRNTLLDLGFEMVQYSVYMRFFSSSKKIESHCKTAQRSLPKGGKVSILQITDKQYEKIVNFHGTKKEKPDKPPDQLELF